MGLTPISFYKSRINSSRVYYIAHDTTSLIHKFAPLILLSCWRACNILLRKKDQLSNKFPSSCSCVLAYSWSCLHKHACFSRLLLMHFEEVFDDSWERSAPLECILLDTEGYSINADCHQGCKHQRSFYRSGNFTYFYSCL